MNILGLVVLALKQTWRHPLRSGLTIVGVATGMFLYTTVETMNMAMQEATRVQATDNTLVVYRENRFCPFTSRLPEHYISRIEAIAGVTEAVPIKVVVNNCGTSLDVVTFRGLPPERFDSFFAQRLDLIAGTTDAWHRRGDAALVGEVLARRRGLSVGDSFDAAGVTVQIAGIIASTEPQDRNVAYVHLPFLQQAARGGLGEVTQFNVKLTDPAKIETVARAIDATFRSDQEPTHTRPEKAFVAETAKELVHVIGFTRWVGLGAVVAVVALVANTVLLAVRSRVREFAVLATIGFGTGGIMLLVLAEGLLLGVGGGLLGISLAVLTLHQGGFSLSSEGISIIFEPTLTIIGTGLVLALLLGLVAGLIPAWRAARQPIVESLRLA